MRCHTGTAYTVFPCDRRCPAWVQDRQWAFCGPPVKILCLTYGPLAGSGVLHHTGLTSEGSRHGGQSWTEELIAQNAANSIGEEEAPKTLAEEAEYPAVERKLRSWYYHWVSALLASCLLAGAVPFSDPVKGG